MEPLDTVVADPQTSRHSRSRYQRPAGLHSRAANPSQSHHARTSRRAALPTNQQNGPDFGRTLPRKREHDGARHRHPSQQVKGARPRSADCLTHSTDQKVVPAACPMDGEPRDQAVSRGHLMVTASWTARGWQPSRTTFGFGSALARLPDTPQSCQRPWKRVRSRRYSEWSVNRRLRPWR